MADSLNADDSAQKSQDLVLVVSELGCADTFDRCFSNFFLFCVLKFVCVVGTRIIFVVPLIH